MSSEPGYPYADTEAAKMMSEGLDRALKEKGMSQRSFAALMDYKSSVYVSHMQMGRTLIPVERSLDIARLLDLDHGKFLMAVLEQRYPGIDFRRLLSNVKGGASLPKGLDKQTIAVLQDFEAIAGTSMSDLPAPKMEVLRKVLSDNKPERRWVDMNELLMLDMVRKARPDLIKNGMTAEQRAAFSECIANL